MFSGHHPALFNWRVVNISFLQGNSIHEAARQGDLDTVRHFINEGTDVNIKDHDGASIRSIWLDWYTADMSFS